MLTMKRRFYDIIRFFLIMTPWLLFSCNVVDKLANTPPVIEKVAADRTLCTVGDTLGVQVKARDVDDDPLSASWTADGGVFIGQQGMKVEWVAPSQPGVFTLRVTVSDDKGGDTDDRITITVLSREKPTVRITRPLDGALITALGNLKVEVTAEPIGFISVAFLFNGVRKAVDAAPPYSTELALAGLSGPLRIEAIASRTDQPAMSSADSVRIIVQGVIPIPRLDDTAGPGNRRE
jgi:hypothetical protein